MLFSSKFFAHFPIIGHWTAVLPDGRRVVRRYKDDAHLVATLNAIRLGGYIETSGRDFIVKVNGKPAEWG